MKISNTIKIVKSISKIINIVLDAKCKEEDVTFCLGKISGDDIGMLVKIKAYFIVPDEETMEQSIYKLNLARSLIKEVVFEGQNVDIIIQDDSVYDFKEKDFEIGE